MFLTPLYLGGDLSPSGGIGLLLSLILFAVLAFIVLGVPILFCVWLMMGLGV